jgi:hypothetical protein
MGQIRIWAATFPHQGDPRRVNAEFLGMIEEPGQGGEVVFGERAAWYVGGVTKVDAEDWDAAGGHVVHVDRRVQIEVAHDHPAAVDVDGG